MPLEGRNCFSSRLVGLKEGESRCVLETCPSPVTGPAPASQTPLNPQSLQQAGLPTPPARSSHQGHVAPGFAPHLF